MTDEEMIRILEELILDPKTNATAKCTAIRTLRELEPEEKMDPEMAALYELAPRRAYRTKMREK